MISILDFSGADIGPSVKTVSNDGRPDKSVVRDAIRQNGSVAERIDYCVGDVHVSVRVNGCGVAQAVRIVWADRATTCKAEMIELAEHTWAAFRHPQQAA